MAVKGGRGRMPGPAIRLRGAPPARAAAPAHEDRYATVQGVVEAASHSVGQRVARGVAPAALRGPMAGSSRRGSPKPPPNARRAGEPFAAKAGSRVGAIRQRQPGGLPDPGPRLGPQHHGVEPAPQDGARGVDGRRKAGMAPDACLAPCRDVARGVTYPPCQRGSDPEEEERCAAGC